MIALPRPKRACSVNKMFNLSQDQLFKWLISAFLCGIALGFFYEIIRAFKMVCGVRYHNVEAQKKNVPKAIFEYLITFVTDIAFWLVVGVLSILLIYQMGDGIFRGMTYIGLFAGFCLYYFTLGKHLLKLNEKIILKLKKLFLIIARVLLLPVRKIFYAFVTLYRLTIGAFIGKIKEKKKLRKDQCTIAEDKSLHEDDEAGRKEEFVYVDGKNGYKKSGRICFGAKSK